MKVISSDSMQVEFEVPEADLFILKEGQAVNMELYWETENGKTYSGQIASISYMNTARNEESNRKTYTAYATIDADERIRAGMTVIVKVEKSNTHDPTNVTIIDATHDDEESSDDVVRAK